MKTIILTIVVLVFLYGCAGMDYQYQRNMMTNAVSWGLIGAVTGAGIAAATGGDAGKAAILGGIGGAYIGAAFTPPSYQYGYYYKTDCSSFPTEGERNACERGRSNREKAIQREREHRAYDYGYRY